MSILGGGREPNLSNHHDGRGPAAIGNGGLPFNVFCFAPVKRKADNVGIALRRRVPICEWPAEFEPGYQSSVRCQQWQEERENPKSLPGACAATRRMTTVHSNKVITRRIQVNA